MALSIVMAEMRVGIDLIEIARVARALRAPSPASSSAYFTPTKSANTASRGRIRPALRRPLRRQGGGRQGARVSVSRSPGARSRSPAGRSRGVSLRARHAAWAERVRGGGDRPQTMTHSKEMAAAVAVVAGRMIRTAEAVCRRRDAGRKMRPRSTEIGIPGAVLMERAGLAAAQEILAACAGSGADGRWSVVSGGNGGDGFVVARHLHAAGWGRSSACSPPIRPALPGDARTNHAIRRCASACRCETAFTPGPAQRPPV